MQRLPARDLASGALSFLLAAPLAAQTTPASVPVTFFGEVRSRSEWDRPGGDVRADAFTYLRSRFGARVDAAPHARLVLQLQDSRVLGAESNTGATAPDAFDLHQGYLELSGTWRGTSAAARAGRQEIAFGNERLVGAANWTNTGRAFDGVRLTFAPRGARPGAEPWTASLFGATVEERGRRFGGTSSPAAPDHAAAGLFAARTLGAGAVELTALYDAGGAYRGRDEASRTTVDVRLRHPRVLGLRAELEAAYQAGAQRYAVTTVSHRQTVGAWLAGARLGTPDAKAAATLGVDVLSGDADPTDGRYSAFGTMYATNHGFYGFMDLFADPAGRSQDRGLVDAKALGTLALTPSTALRAELHHFGPATRRASDAAGAFGWEADVVAPVKLSPNAGVELGLTSFRAGPGAAAIGLGADGHVRSWAYLQLRVGF